MSLYNRHHLDRLLPIEHSCHSTLPRSVSSPMTLDDDRWRVLLELPPQLIHFSVELDDMKTCISICGVHRQRDTHANTQGSEPLTIGSILSPLFICDDEVVQSNQLFDGVDHKVSIPIHRSCRVVEESQLQQSGTHLQHFNVVH